MAKVKRPHMLIYDFKRGIPLLEPGLSRIKMKKLLSSPISVSTPMAQVYPKERLSKRLNLPPSFS